MNFRNKPRYTEKGYVERWCAVLKEVGCKYRSNPPMRILGAFRPLLYSTPWPLLQKGRAENIPRPCHLEYRLRVIPSQSEYWFVTYRHCSCPSNILSIFCHSSNLSNLFVRIVILSLREGGSVFRHRFYHDFTKCSQALIFRTSSWDPIHWL